MRCRTEITTWQRIDRRMRSIRSWGIRLSIASQVNIYFFPVLMLFIIWIDARLDNPKELSSRLFRAVVLCSCATMVLEACMWFMSGRNGSIPAVVLATNTLYLVAASAISVAWVAYVYAQIHEGRSILSNRAATVAVIAPYVVVCVIVVANCFAGFIFSVDETATYRRGPLYLLPYLVTIGYQIAALIMSLAAARERADDREQRAKFIRLSSFMLLPMIGAIVQMSTFGWWVMWPCAAVTLMFVYLTVQNRSIMVDALTSLNNRRSFDRRLREYLQRPEEEGAWCLIMIDVDGLKGINDQHGHQMGDEVLCRMADAMRASFKGSDAFLARYGGDEFAVLVDCEGGEDAQAMIGRLSQEAEQVNKAAYGSCELQFSAGYALRDFSEGEEIGSLLSSADREMYRHKLARKSLSAYRLQTESSRDVGRMSSLTSDPSGESRGE